MSNQGREWQQKGEAERLGNYFQNSFILMAKIDSNIQLAFKPKI